MYYDIYYFLFFLFLYIFDIMTVLLIIIGSLFSISLILKVLNNYMGSKKLNIPRVRYVYYNNKEYYYRIKGVLLPFLGDISMNKFRIKVYSVKRIIGIPFRKHINSTSKRYGDSHTFSSISSLKTNIISLIIEYNDKDSQPGWDGCLDEVSRIARKRKKNIDTIVDD